MQAVGYFYSETVASLQENNIMPFIEELTRETLQNQNDISEAFQRMTTSHDISIIQCRDAYTDLNAKKNRCNERIIGLGSVIDNLYNNAGFAKQIEHDISLTFYTDECARKVGMIISRDTRDILLGKSLPQTMQAAIRVLLQADTETKAKYKEYRDTFNNKSKGTPFLE